MHSPSIILSRRLTYSKNAERQRSAQNEETGHRLPDSQLARNPTSAAADRSRRRHRGMLFEILPKGGADDADTTNKDEALYETLLLCSYSAFIDGNLDNLERDRRDSTSKYSQFCRAWSRRGRDAENRHHSTF